MCTVKKMNFWHDEATIQIVSLPSIVLLPESLSRNVEVLAKFQKKSFLSHAA
jgi:hypothetical protein